MAAKYRVETNIKVGFGYNDPTTTDFAIERTGEGVLVRGSDPVLLNRICDLLNAEDGTGDSPHQNGKTYQRGSRAVT